MKPFLIRLSKALLRLALDEGLKRVLPRVYKQLDAEVPLLMYNNATPAQVQGAIASAISNATGRRASASQIEAVIGLYDPVKAAINRLR